MKTLLTFCILSVAAPLGLLAQAAAWAPVQGLALGERIEVKLFSRGGRMNGTVEQVTDETLVVRHKKGVATFNRADVRRVRIDSGKKSRFGQITGIAIMAAVSLNVDHPRWNRVADVAFATGSGFLAGWGIDGMVDDYRRKTIYEGQRPPKR
jgi:hypothetical protein